MELKNHHMKRVSIRNSISARASEKGRTYHQKSKFCWSWIIESLKKNFVYFTISSKINPVLGLDLTQSALLVII